MTREAHNIPPVYGKDSRVLILGSFPSRKSREDKFFYAHPRNRFWRVISSICEDALPITVKEKRALLLRHGIALWDVCAECDIEASSDAAIRNVIPNDILRLLSETSVKHIFTNGTTANRLYNKLIFPITNIHAIHLPSTSPANAAKTLEALLDEWQTVKPYIL
ncbi:MAG: DNA-deoxyinosine glycosylase [Clostridia bacterium]|nr:DNA-deoxyinosine glycosylase [Clostridia bacterium]